MLETAITLAPLQGAAVLAGGQNPVLQHLFQDGAMVLAHNVSERILPPRGTLQRAPTLAEQFVNAEAMLWQINGGMSLVHGAFPTLGQLSRSLDLSIRTVGAHGRAPLHLMHQPLLATAGGSGFRAQDSGRSAAEQLYSQMASMGEGGPPRQPPPIPKDRLVTFQNFAAVPRPVDAVLHELRKTATGKTLTVVLAEFLPNHFWEMGRRLFQELENNAPELKGRTLIFRSPLIHNFPFQNKRASLSASDVRFEFHYEMNDRVRWTLHNAPK